MASDERWPRVSRDHSPVPVDSALGCSSVGEVLDALRSHLEHARSAFVAHDEPVFAAGLACLIGIWSMFLRPAINRMPQIGHQAAATVPQHAALAGLVEESSIFAEQAQLLGHERELPSMVSALVELASFPSQRDSMLALDARKPLYGPVLSDLALQLLYRRGRSSGQTEQGWADDIDVATKGARALGSATADESEMGAAHAVHVLFAMRDAVLSLDARAPQRDRLFSQVQQAITISLACLTQRGLNPPRQQAIGSWLGSLGQSLGQSLRSPFVVRRRRSVAARV